MPPLFLFLLQEPLIMRVIAVAVLAAVAVSVSAFSQELTPGLIGEYFQRDEIVADFPLIKPDVKPALKRVEQQVAFNSVEGEFHGTQLRARFYVRWSGFIKIAAAGRYTFFTESDDGSRLLINGNQAVDNQGLHGMQEEECDVELPAGTHRIKIEFFQNDGAGGCIARWKTPAGARETIPASVFFHDAREESSDVQTAVASDPPPPVPELPPEPAADATLDAKAASVLPRPEEDRWLQVPWRLNLQQARAESQASGKPIFLWIMNGHPMACT